MCCLHVLPHCSLAGVLLPACVVFAPGLVFASGHAGPCKKSLPRPALRGGAGDLFFSTLPCALSRAPHFQGPVFAVSGAPFFLPPAKSLFWGTIFCGALSGALLIVVNFVPEMRISGVC